MQNTIFLLTVQKDVERQILDCIPINYNLINVTKTDLLMKLYNYSPIMLIIDADNLNEQTLDMINSIISLMYLPVIYIYSVESSAVLELLKEEVTLKLESIALELKSLLRQATKFKKRYDDITESYDAIDLLSTNVKNLLHTSITDEENERDTLISELFNLVLNKNQFISNKPELFWLIHPYEDCYTGLSFNRNKTGEFSLNTILKLDSNLYFAHDVSSENGFYKNFDTEEISDIDSSSSIFPKSMLKESKKLKNVVGYSIEKITILGMNYTHEVSNYDISIIKGIAIYFDLISTIKTNVKEIEKSFEYTTNALARAAEVNDDTTGSHIKRVNTFSKIIAEEMGLDSVFVKTIYNAAQMHDVGKIYVDKNILTKPGKLTSEEFDNMKKHTIFGEVIIGDSQNLKMAAEIARNHHEKYDGSGYPDGKKGEDIPLSARIVALADIYDALRSKRAYKPGFTHEEAYNIIINGDGRVMPEHFDPMILEAFKNIHLEMAKVFDELTDV